MFEYREDLIKDVALSKVWEELENIYSKLNEPQNSGGSIKDGQFLKKGKGYLTTDIQAREFAPTCVLVGEAVGKSFKYTEMDVLINYYGDGDYYKPHKDNAVKTVSVPLCKKDSDFTGGDFKFTDLNIIIPFKNNSCIIFNSRLSHEVKPINMNKIGDMLGRFSLTFFYV